MSDAVQRMFATIASRYDLANDILSLGIHRLWRRRAVRALQLGPDSVVLDLCTGTGDFAFEVSKQLGSGAKVIGVDFVPQMLSLARQKAVQQKNAEVLFVHGDAMSLGIRSESMQAATIGFGIRNVDDPLTCLKDIRRVLSSGGKLAILEFGQPENPIFSSVYWFYARFVLPLIGGFVTGNRAAYEYLPRTSQSFPCGSAFNEILRNAGFTEERSQPLFGGIAWLYTAKA